MIATLLQIAGLILTPLGAGLSFGVGGAVLAVGVELVLVGVAVERAGS